MKNIEKKWTLFLIATFVTFFGIVNVIVKGTKAIEVPVNEAFDDVNFYKCVVDAYNEEYDTTYDYTVDVLSDEQLKSIYFVRCTGDEETKKIESTTGLEKLESLFWLEISTSDITQIDLSNNKELITLILDDFYLTDLDLTSNNNLEYLEISDENGTIENVNLALDSKENLLKLYLYNVSLSNLDLTSNNNLKYLGILDENKTIENVNLALDSKENLLELTLYNVGLSNLDLTSNILLESLAIKKMAISELDLSYNTSLEILKIEDTNISELDLSSNVALNKVVIGDNNFSKDVVTYLDNDFTLEKPITISSDTTLGELVWKVENEDYITTYENDNFVGNLVGESKISLYLGDTLLFSNDVLIVEVTSSTYEIVDDKILVGSATKEEILNNIEYDFDLTLDVDDECTMLKVMYGNVALKEFEIVREEEVITEEIVFDSNLAVDKDKMLIKNIVVGMTIDDLRSKIITSGEISVFDDEDNLIEDVDSKLKTSDKIKIMFSNNEVLTYTISVLGDVDNDGDITSDDLVLCARHLIKGNIIVGDDHISAADINNDGKISINDVIKLTKQVVSDS